MIGTDMPGGGQYLAGWANINVPFFVKPEAIVPLNSEAGHGVGGRAQLLLFLDDLIPSLFRKPLLSR
jgi:hypothetical protein